ncbi:MAG: GC-type dockerin domain-anchored protein [Phycisphaerales bacterium]
MSILRSTIIVAALALSAPAFGQAALYSNGSANPSTPALSTGPTSAGGAAAPAGASWSELAYDGAAANAIAGFSTHTLGGAQAPYRFASRMVVPMGGWRVNAISFYAYQPGYAGAGSPFGAINLRIWNGVPGNAGATVVWGDDTSNILSSSTATDIYRVFNSSPGSLLPATPDTTRRIWRNDASVGNTLLAAGTYWLDWQIVPSDPDEDAYSPPITAVGTRAAGTIAARQFKTSTLGGTWSDVFDLGKPSSAADTVADLPYIVRGARGCPADVASLGGALAPDGQMTVDDIVAFLSAFFAANLAVADVAGLGGSSMPDGQLSADDVVYFLSAFFSPCP